MSKAIKLLSLWEVADLLGIRRFALTNCRPYLQGFPKPVKGPGKTLLYPEHEVLAWAEGRDLKAALKAAYKTRRTEPHAEPAPAQSFNSHAKQFLTGAYLPPAAKHAADFKKLVARTIQPKTTRVQLVHDWMLEDGPAATHRRAS